MNQLQKRVDVEYGLVLFANTVSEPLAMVIKSGHASVARSAMLAAQRLIRLSIYLKYLDNFAKSAKVL